VNKHSKYI